MLALTEVGEYGGADGGDGEPRGTDEGPQCHHTARVSVLTTAFARWRHSSLLGRPPPWFFMF